LNSYNQFFGKNIRLNDLPSYFPRNPCGNEEIAIFINGDFRINHLPSFVERINACAGIILVDGGANSFCKLMQICHSKKIELTSRPLAIIGDLDSATSESLEQIQSMYKTEIIRLDRYKDFTDLEAALKLVKLNSIARATIFNALGGRVDQTLGNILNLFREPYQGKVSIFCDDNELLFVVGHGKSWLLDKHKGMYVTVIPLYGNGEIIFDPPQKKIKPSSYFLQEEKVHLRSERDGVLCLVHNATIDDLILPQHGEYPYEFNMPGKILQDFQVILHCVHHPMLFSIKTRIEKIFAINPKSETVSFEVEVGQTISLIPLGGPATGINMQGLEWALTDGKMDIDFIGISNIATSNTVLISVETGTLLCVINIPPAVSL